MMRNTITLLLAIVLLASCNQYEKAPSGLTYKISKGGSKETLKHGQFVKMNIEHKLMPKDSMLMSTYGHIPAYFMIDTSKQYKYTFWELLTKAAPGDKVSFSLNVDTLKKMGQVDPSMTGVIDGKFEIVKTFATEQEMVEDNKKEVEVEKQKELKDLQAYAKEKNIKTISTPSGVLVEIQNPGTGQKADSGWQVAVMYRGVYAGGEGKALSKLKDIEFDSNNQPTSERKEPLVVVIGSHNIIPGWEDGLRQFAKGGKGRLLVPALLAYGPQGYGKVPPYANMVFEVEVLDVTKPTPPAPGAPGAQPPQQ